MSVFIISEKTQRLFVIDSFQDHNMYNWEQKDWGSFYYDEEKIEKLIFEFNQKAGLIFGLCQGLSHHFC